MTHDDEADLESRVETLLADRYGRDAVARQYVYPTGRRVDLLVDIGLVSVAIECEDSAEDLIPGLGQTLLYATHDPQGRTVPCIVVPDEHDHGTTLDEPERQYIEEHAAVFTERELRGRLERGGLRD